MSPGKADRGAIFYRAARCPKQGVLARPEEPLCVHTRLGKKGKGDILRMADAATPAATASSRPASVIIPVYPVAGFSVFLGPDGAHVSPTRAPLSGRHCR